VKGMRVFSRGKAAHLVFKRCGAKGRGVVGKNSRAPQKKDGKKKKGGGPREE